MSEHSIELDCPPGSPRPGDLIMGVVKDTPLEAVTTPEGTVVRIFGNWVWEYDGFTDLEWEAIQTVTMPRVKALYMSGVIRYGSW